MKADKFYCCTQYSLDISLVFSRADTNLKQARIVFGCTRNCNQTTMGKSVKR